MLFILFTINVLTTYKHDNSIYDLKNSDTPYREETKQLESIIETACLKLKNNLLAYGATEKNISYTCNIISVLRTIINRKLQDTIFTCYYNYYKKELYLINRVLIIMFRTLNNPKTITIKSYDQILKNLDNLNSTILEIFSDEEEFFECPMCKGSLMLCSFINSSNQQYVMDLVNAVKQFNSTIFKLMIDKIIEKHTQN